MPKRARQDGEGDDTQVATSSSTSSGDKKRVVFNVSGQRFETNMETITKFPRTMLGAMFGGSFVISADTNGEYFLDRDPRLFEVVLNWYRHGKIFQDPSIDPDALREECEFFNIPYPTPKDDKAPKTTHPPILDTLARFIFSRINNLKKKDPNCSSFELLFNPEDQSAGRFPSILELKEDNYEFYNAIAVQENRALLHDIISDIDERIIMRWTILYFNDSSSTKQYLLRLEWGSAKEGEVDALV